MRFLQKQLKPRSELQALPSLQILPNRKMLNLNFSHEVTIFLWASVHMQGTVWNKLRYILTFELNGTHDQSLALMLGLQLPGPTPAASAAAAGVAVRGGTDQDLALEVHRVCASHEHEGLECKTGPVPAPRRDGAIRAVNSTPGSKNRKKNLFLAKEKKNKQKKATLVSCIFSFYPFRTK